MTRTHRRNSFPTGRIAPSYRHEDGERILWSAATSAPTAWHSGRQAFALYGLCRRASEQCLPVTLDVGTNNESFSTTLLHRPAQKRITGAAYDEIRREFMTAARAAFPGVLIQFEHWHHSAFACCTILATRLASSTTTPGTAPGGTRRMFSPLRTTGGKLRDQTILFLAQARPATGIADLVVSAMMAEARPEADGCGAPGWWTRAVRVKDRRAEWTQAALCP